MIEPLIVNGLYNRAGRVFIALNETNLAQVAATDGIIYTATEEYELFARPGTDTWIGHMTKLRVALIQDLANERAALTQRNIWISKLGEALLAKAKEHKWCEEYDEFASEWGLPTRNNEYMVTMTLTVTAADLDEARQIVGDHFHLTSYSDEVVSGPEFEAEKVER